jgi:hypothetical protein
VKYGKVRLVLLLLLVLPLLLFPALAQTGTELDSYEGLIQNYDFEDGATEWQFSLCGVQTSTVYEGTIAAYMDDANDWIGVPSGGVWNDGTGGVTNITTFDFYAVHDGVGSENIQVTLVYHDETDATHNYAVGTSWTYIDVMADLSSTKGLYNFLIRNPAGSTVDFFVDYVQVYQNLNITVDHPSGAAGLSSFGQTFTTAAAPTYYLSEAAVKVEKIGSPTGTLTARLYATLAGSPVGSALASSATVNVAGLTANMTEQLFTFSDDYLMSASTTYYLAVELDSADVDGSNHIGMATDWASNEVHAGTLYYYNNSAYSSQADEETVFYLYGTEYVENVNQTWLEVAYPNAFMAITMFSVMPVISAALISFIFIRDGVDGVAAVMVVVGMLAVTVILMIALPVLSAFMEL